MINNFLNGPNNSRFFSKIQQLNTDSSAQKDGNIPDEMLLKLKNITPIDNNNQNLLSQMLQINLLYNLHNNNINDSSIIDRNNNNFLININKIKDNNYNSDIYNNIISNNINNYNNIINNNNLSFSLGQNPSNNNINIIQFKNNNLNNINIIPNLTQIKNSNGINNINLSNINEINSIFNINNINNISNQNIIFNPNDINLSNLNQNLNYYNSLNQINNIKNNLDIAQINNNINCINIIKNNFINNSNIINNNFYQKNIELLLNNDKYTLNDNKSNKNILEDFMKYIKNLSMPLVKFLCTPKGTLEIQKKLGKSNTECKILLVKLLNKEGLTVIMKNTYGNYFFQQLIKGAEEIIISLIISYIADTFIEISEDSSGTFSIQALLNEISSIADEQKVLNYIKNHEMEMAFNKNATYVIQKIVLLFPDIHRVYLNEIIINNLRDLCIDSNGICLIKNFIKTNTLINDKKRIIIEIIKNFVILAESPFGNYGIQFLMDNWDRNELNDIKNKIMENLYNLSVQQFSSNVVEKSIEIFDDEYREIIIKKLCFESNFINLLKNKFGRFVLGKAINYMKSNLKNEFELYLINNINNNIYSNKDKNKVKKFVMKLKNNKVQNDFNFDYVRNNMSNICNYNIKNNFNNNTLRNNDYFL